MNTNQPISEENIFAILFTLISAYAIGLVILFMCFKVAISFRKIGSNKQSKK